MVGFGKQRGGNRGRGLRIVRGRMFAELLARRLPSVVVSHAAGSFDVTFCQSYAHACFRAPCAQATEGVGGGKVTSVLM